MVFRENMEKAFRRIGGILVITYLFKLFPVKISISNYYCHQFFRLEKSKYLLITDFIKSSLKFLVNCLYGSVENVINTLRNIVFP